MRQFIVDIKDVSEKKLVIRCEEARHMLQVLRMTAGDDFYAVDGHGTRYHCRIEKTGRDDVVALITDREFQKKTMNQKTIALFVALAKPQVMEHILKGGTELGVDRFFFFPASRSVTGYPSITRMTRWNKIIREAAKQCHRLTLPSLEVKESFSRIVPLAKEFDVALIATLAVKGEKIGEIIEKFSGQARWACMIGPEGDFTGSEVKLACHEGWKITGLGEHALRVETAALYTVAKFV